MTGFTPIQSVCTKLLLLPAIFASTTSLLTAQTTEWLFHKTADGSHPDGNEQQMVWLMNRARANPAAEGAFLANTGDPDVTFGLNYFGVNLPLMMGEFAATAPKPPAAFDRRLYEGSLAHANDLIARNSQDHSGQIARLNAAGNYYTYAAVSVYSYAASSLMAHAALNVDWGSGIGNMLSTRAHRNAIQSNTASFLATVGFAVVPERNSATAVGPYVFSGAYVTPSVTRPDHYNRFMVGTVWSDKNNNNRYDPGEGLNQVRVQPTGGRFHAVTGNAGGWSIPADPGSYVLTFSGGGLAQSFSRQVTVGADSVLVDTKVSAPFQAAIHFQPTAGGLMLSWSGGTPPYQVQRMSSQSPVWSNVGGPTMATSMAVPTTGPSGIYRVLASP